MLKPFYNEAQVRASEDVSLRLVMNFRTIDVLEGLTGQGMDDLLREILVANPAHSLVGKFIWAMTREHHSDLSLDQIAGFIYSKEYGPTAGAVIGELLQRTFNIGEGEQSSRPPRKSRGKSRASAKSGLQPA